MPIISSTLEAKVRTGAGKGFARRTRAEGLIPAVVYGPHLDKPLNVSVEPKALRAAIATPKKLNTVLGLNIDGAQHMVLLKDYQLDPVTRELLHADFIDVRENEPVKVKVPVVLTGRAAGVVEGGVLTQMRRELEVWALPGSIPQQLEVDVTPMKIGSVLHVNDVKLPPGVTIKTHVNYTVAVCTAPEADKGAEAAAAAATGAPAAGDAKAADAKGGDKKEDKKEAAKKEAAKK